RLTDLDYPGLHVGLPVIAIWASLGILGHPVHRDARIGLLLRSRADWESAPRGTRMTAAASTLPRPRTGARRGKVFPRFGLLDILSVVWIVILLAFAVVPMLWML